MALRVGIDTGGTFTDLIAIDEDNGGTFTAKVPSTPARPARAVAEALSRLLDDPVEVARLVVGCTVATNAIIERRGPRVFFLTNRGFTDVPFIGRIDKERLYDLHWRKPPPLVERADCLGIGGRFDAAGVEVEELDEDDLEAASAALAAAVGEEPCAVAVTMLFSYLDEAHEAAVAARLRQRLPELQVSVSHEVSPLWREYERASTTIADAFVKPVVSDYVDGVEQTVAAAAGLSGWSLLASNGGYLSAAEAIDHPVQLALSGLAGGVIGGAAAARAAGTPSAFTLDMGGTSCDIGLVVDGEHQYASEFDLAFGLPVTLPCVAVATIGAGGGSIGWVDEGGLLRVGPRSAGAEPGPAAYGRGGEEPTVTDANLVLGRLDPDRFLGGEMALDAGAAHRAVAAVGAALGLDAVAAALAMVRVADENMANAIRLMAVERGLDPRDFALVAFGGAGPLEARAVAERLEIGTVVVPPSPGLCSAFGTAIAEARVDRQRTVAISSVDPDLGRLAAIERAVREEAVTALRRSVAAPAPRLRRTAAMRYAGQNFELEVELPEGELDAPGWERLLERFEVAHEAKYGFRLPGEPVDLIDLRVTAILAEPPPVPAPPLGGEGPERRRPVHFDGPAATDCAVLDRAELAPGDELQGPAIIEETDSTTLVWAGDAVRVGADGGLVLRVGEAGR